MDTMIADITVEDVIIVCAVIFALLIGFGHGIGLGKGIAK
ncbi:hypothetical protein MTYP_01895 [Methylophilaceae bacterium]|nr:hypothetical protein MTYP_01895 [Methylophilaceae bacterium]